MRLKFLIGSGEAAPGGVLAPVLAPFGLDLHQVSKEINAQSSTKFIKGVPLPIKVLILPSKQFKVEVLPPTLNLLLSTLINNSVSEIELVELYTLFLLFCRDRTLLPSRSTARTLFSTLSSYNNPLPIKL